MQIVLLMAAHLEIIMRQGVIGEAASAFRIEHPLPMVFQPSVKVSFKFLKTKSTLNELLY